MRPLGPWCKRILLVQELKLQLLHDWSHAFAQGNRKIDDAFRYVSHAFVTEVNVTTRPTTRPVMTRIARKRGASRNVPFLDGAFDVARVFRVNVEHMGDVADTTEFFKVYRNDVNGSMAQLFSAEAKAFGIVVDQIVAIVRAALRLPHETEAFSDTSSPGFKVVAPEGVYPSPVAIVEVTPSHHCTRDVMYGKHVGVFYRISKAAARFIFHGRWNSCCV